MECNIEQLDSTVVQSSNKLVTAGGDSNGVDMDMVGEGHQAGTADDVIHFG